MAPYLSTSIKSSLTTADLTINWYALVETGGVSLTGYKLYQTRVSTSTTSLAYDGTNIPQITSVVIPNLVLDEDYEFYVTGLNPDEGPASPIFTVRAAALPLVPGTIIETPSTRTGTSIGV